MVVKERTCERETFQSKSKMQLTKKQNKGKAAKEVIATAQDIKYARYLAGNDKTTRDRAVKSLKKWFEQRSSSQLPFNDSDLMLIWKGLFYSMWMSDKPLIQEECADRIASLIHSLDMNTGFQFFKTGMKTLANEWFGIDQWRHDKFLMFVRRLLRQCLILLKNNAWNLKFIKVFATTLEESILNTKNNAPLSLLMHFCDIYMPELAKVSEGQLNPNILNEFLHPFVKALSMSNDLRVVNAISDNVFRYLMKQSNVALEYEDKYRAWKKMGFPGGNINYLQRDNNDEDLEEEEEDEDLDEDSDDELDSIDQDNEENGETNEIDEDLLEDVDDEEEEDIDDEEEEDIEDEEEEEKTGLDPRAGRVNVILPQVNFSCKNISALMNEYKFKATNTRARSVIKKLIQEFNDISEGDYPLGIKKVDLYRNDGSTKLKKAVNKLVKFEKQLYGRNKNQKRKLNDLEENEESDGEDQQVPVLKKTKLKQNTNPEQKSKLNQKELKQTKNIQNKQVKTDQKQTKKDEKKEIKEKLNKKLEKTKLQKVENIQHKGDEEDELDLLMQIAKSVKIAKKLKQQKALKLKKRNLEHEQLLQKADDVFVRNSGTWMITEPESESEYETDSPKKINTSVNTNTTSTTNGKSPKLSPKQKNISTPLKSPPKSLKTSLSPKSQNTPVSTSFSVSVPSMSSISSTPLANVNGSTPMKTSPSKLQSGQKLFKTSEWDADLMDGEVELFVPSKKYLAKRKSVGAPTDLVERSFGIIKAKNRRKTMDPKAVLNLSATSPRSNKKVKIDLRLNQSQEVYEHHAQIKSSPGIPFDASKKPVKPVIKANAMPSPINPFYNRRRIGIQF